MKQKNTKAEPRNTHEIAAYRVRLPGFTNDKDVGFGDVIKRATHAIGIKPCGGCGRRAAVLNRWIVFTGPRSR